MAKEKLYSVWANMKSRCNNPNQRNYQWYGNKNISVCESWSSSYQAFREWSIANGYAEGMSIERKDNSKGYNPDNCCYIPLKDQRLNESKRGPAIRRLPKPNEWWREPPQLDEWWRQPTWNR